MKLHAPEAAGGSFEMAGRPNPSSRNESPVFLCVYGVGLLLSTGLLLYVPYQIVTWSRLGAGGREPSAWQGALLVFLAVVSTFHWGRAVAMYLLSFLHRDRGFDESPPELERWPFVSIWIPAYNEAEGIEGRWNRCWSWIIRISRSLSSTTAPGTKPMSWPGASRAGTSRVRCASSASPTAASGPPTTWRSSTPAANWSSAWTPTPASSATPCAGWRPAWPTRASTPWPATSACATWSTSSPAVRRWSTSFPTT